MDTKELQNSFGPGNLHTHTAWQTPGMEDPFATILILFCATPFEKLSISEGIVRFRSRPNAAAAAIELRIISSDAGQWRRTGSGKDMWQPEDEDNLLARQRKSQIEREHLQLSWPTCAGKMRMIFGGKLELAQENWKENVWH